MQNTQNAERANAVYTAWVESINAALARGTITHANALRMTAIAQSDLQRALESN